MPNPFDKFDKPQQQGFYPVGGVDPTRAPTIQRVTNEGAASVYDAPQKRETLRRTQLENDKLAREAKDKAAAEAIIPTSNVHGPAYLNTVPANMRGVVAGVVQGRIPLPANALRTPYWQQVLAHATNMDPKFDAVNFNARSAARKDFTSGPDGASLTALETALLHEGQVKKAAEGLNNWSSPLINSVRDAYMHLTGDGVGRISDFENKREAYVGEKQKVFVPTNGTEGDRIAARNQLPVNAAPDSFSKVFSGDATLYRSRLEALQAKYQRAMGTTADITDLLSPEAQRTYADLTGQKSGSIPFGGVYGEAGSGGGPGPGADGPPSVISGHPGGGPGGLQGILNSYTGNANPGARSVVGGDEANRTAFDPGLSAELNTLIRARKTPEEINTYLKSRGADPVDAAGVFAAQAYLKSNPGYKASVGYATKSVPNTTWERISGSPLAAASVGATNAATAGFMDEIGGGVSALFGGDYKKTRDRIDAGKTVLAAAHPYANIAGNIAGGAASMLGGGELLDAAAGAGGLLGKTATAVRGLNEVAPVIGDAAYGAAYGAGENNDNRLGGAGTGMFAGGAGGAAGRGITSGVGSAIAPTGGNLAPLYEQGTFPSLGQRAAAAQGPISSYLGKAYGKVEEGLQSLPLAGFLPFRARQIPREQFQLGAFNSALGEIGDRLPAGMKPGHDPHSYAADSFGRAYDDARSGMTFAHDPEFDAARSAWRDQLHSGVLSGDQVAQVKQVVNNAVGSRLDNTNGTHLSGDAYKAAASDLSNAARAWSKSDPDKAGALKDYIGIFDDAARRNSDPAAVAKLDAADKGYAKLVRVQDATAARGGDSGTFTPAQFDRSVQRNSGGVRSSAYNQGDALMQDYGDAGKSLIDTLPNSGTYDRTLVGQAAAGAGGGGLGLAGISLAGAAKGVAPLLTPYLPGMNYLATRAVAPRSALGINPALATTLDKLGSSVKNRAGMMGRIAAPGVIGYNLEP